VSLPSSPLDHGRPRWVRVGTLRWLLHSEADLAGLRPVLENPESYLTKAAPHLKHDEVVTVARVPAPSPGQSELVLRRLNYGKPRHRLRDLLRPARVFRALRHGWGLEAAGVSTPRALAAAEARWFRWPVAAYLITEYVPGAVTLYDLLAQRGSLPREQVVGLADLLADLHDHGFSHRDLKSTNVLFDGRLRPWLIDLDGVRSFGRLAEAEAIANLARLAREVVAYPRALRWNAPRFLRRYCRRRRMEDRFEALGREVSRRLARRRARAS
jgi:tRNA A-37 threonylcarbamoyl transferase component Bud32